MLHLGGSALLQESDVGDVRLTDDLRVRIPMATGVDSLNVATAAAVAFHEVTRSVG